MSKKTKITLMVIGLIIFFSGLIPYLIKTIAANNFIESNGSSVSGRQNVFLHGNLEIREPARDELFDLEVESPILIRKVEMVQWNKNEKGDVYLVLANYPIESFDVNGQHYDNPEFPLTSEVFYGKTFIGEIELDEVYLDTFIYDRYVNYSSAIKKTKLENLKEYEGTDFDFIILDDAYVTASDDWEVGELRISYQYMPKTFLGEFSAFGTVENNRMTTEQDNPFIYNSKLNASVLKKSLRGNSGLFVIPMVVGLAIFGYAFVSYFFKERKNAHVRNK